MKNLKFSVFVFGLAAAFGCPFSAMATTPIEITFERQIELMESSAERLIEAIDDIKNEAGDAIQQIQRLEDQINNPESAKNFWQRSRFNLIDVRNRIRQIGPILDNLAGYERGLASMPGDLDRRITGLKKEAKKAKEDFQRRRKTKQYQDQKDWERIRNSGK